MTHAPSRQFSFRLPQSLVDRVEACAEGMRRSGLDLSRADVVRLLINHALDVTECKIERLLEPRGAGRVARRARRTP